MLRAAVGDETQADRIADAIAAQGYVCVPRVLTGAMLNAAWADAMAEDAKEVGATTVSYTHLHAVAYVNGNIHTNTMENFWSLLKRALKGTYVSVEPYHLFRYLDEQAFRYNNRLPMSDSDRFSYLVRKIVGKRLTYAELTGKTEDGPKTENEATA